MKAELRLVSSRDHPLTFTLGKTNQLLRAKGIVRNNLDTINELAGLEELAKFLTEQIERLQKR